MRRDFKRWVLICLAAWSCAMAWAEDKLITVPTRTGVSTTYWWMPRDDAVATVVLFSGGSGGIGYKNGLPQSGNFLIRSRDEFAQAGLNVALMGNPDDNKKLTPQFRRSAEHGDDVRHVLQDIAIRSKAPVWLVGTSQGTLSAAASAAELGSTVSGVVLTSTVTGQQAGGSVNDIALEKITVPVLIFHHRQDSCRITPAYAAERLIKRLIVAPVKKYIEVDGGKDPFGDPCEAFHYHGFIGMESQAVQQITSWIKGPAS
jgi:pimeloyl-ACP methyl ester carboxylesterase